MEQKELSRDRVEEILVEFGITPDKQGFWHIVDAVMLCHENKLCSFTYEIAKKTNKTPSAVERAISNALKKIDFYNPEIAEFFGNASRTNTGLIYMLTWKLERELRESTGKNK